MAYSRHDGVPGHDNTLQALHYTHSLKLIRLHRILLHNLQTTACTHATRVWLSLAVSAVVVVVVVVDAVFLRSVESGGCLCSTCPVVVCVRCDVEGIFLR